MVKNYGSVELGKASVDSGQLLIIDPCYLSDWKHGDFDLNKGEQDQDNSYGRAAAITTEEDGKGYGALHGGVVFGSFGGDGNFPVIAHYNTYGEISSIEILFDHDTEEEDEDEMVICSNCGDYCYESELSYNDYCPACQDLEACNGCSELFEPSEINEDGLCFYCSEIIGLDNDENELIKDET